MSHLTSSPLSDYSTKTSMSQPSPQFIVVLHVPNMHHRILLDACLILLHTQEFYLNPSLSSSHANTLRIKSSVQIWFNAWHVHDSTLAHITGKLRLVEASERGFIDHVVCVRNGREAETLIDITDWSAANCYKREWKLYGTWCGAHCSEF